MNELDLSPFKVEFDRKITIADIEHGDIMLCISGDAFTSENPRLVMAFKDENLICGYNDFHLHAFELSRPSLLLNFTATVVKYCVKAIYRINKFKY